MNLLIIGAPGAGKGTMSNLIVDYYKVVHISTGDMLRQAISENSEVGKIASDYINEGKLVPDSIIQSIIVERLKKDDVKNGFLFDGYPRTVKQAESLTSILNDLGKKIDAVINLNVEYDLLVKRIEGRRVCPKCGISYNVYFSKPKIENVCDKCSTNLIIRGDDNPESVKKRLDEFNFNTKPVIDYYKKQGVVKDVNGNFESDVTFKEIQKALEGIR